MQSENRPSKKQRELLSFIDGFIKGHGYGPSYREVMRALDYKSVSTVAAHIDGLIKKGHLIKKDNSARSLEVVSSEAEYKPKSHVSKADEKWLVDKVSKKFDEAEKNGTNQKEIDNLYVLVGALHVLGLKEAANSFKPRLKTFKEQIDEEGK
ncbi:hypothetical protein KC939_00905 [Candidatus Saccharibacteria bacterium]|nr:hypothetical protein [Candidatus Saccharibacteria bacterium]